MSEWNPSGLPREVRAEIERLVDFLAGYYEWDKEDAQGIREALEMEVKFYAHGG